MVFATANRLSKKTARRTRKRASTVTKAKYQPRTARMNRALILANAKAVASLARKHQPIYCDWQDYGSIRSEQSVGGNFTLTRMAIPLSDFSDWTPELRKDTNVMESSSTFWRGFSLNFRYFLNQSDYAQYSMFVVTLRKNATNRRFGSSDPLTLGQDYVESPDAMAVRLNSGVFKVHWTRQVTMTENTFLEPAAPGAQMAGNPNTTWRKGQVNVRVKARVRAPVGVLWKEMSNVQVPYYSRFFILAFINQRSLNDNISSYVSWDALHTTINDA